VSGDGGQYRSFVNIGYAKQIMATLAKDELKTGVYNLSDRILNLNTVIEAVTEVFPETEIFICRSKFAYAQC